MDPVKLTENALDALISTTFINDVCVSTLGLLVPVLTRGMRERAVNVKRRAALVIGNMCKLVNDPRTAAQFYVILKPVLERGIEEIQVGNRAMNNEAYVFDLSFLFSFSFDHWIYLTHFLFLFLFLVLLLSPLIGGRSA